MSWLRLIFETERTRVEALSEALADVGAAAVSLEDNGDEPVLEPAPGETPLWSSTRVSGLFQADASMPAILAELESRCSPLPPHRTEVLEDRDWVRVWMDRFVPMRFGERLWIVPKHCEPPDPRAVNLRLDPGLAFGTGTHPTTALCLEWLDACDCSGRQVIDYGCGSGVLGIAARLLGADRVVGVDIDEQAWVATRANAEANGVDAGIRVGPPEIGSSAADLVLANILAGPLIELASTLVSLTRPGGHIVLSGILAEQADPVMEGYRAWFDLDPPVVKEGWVRITGVRTDDFFEGSFPISG